MLAQFKHIVKVIYVFLGQFLLAISRKVVMLHLFSEREFIQESYSRVLQIPAKLRRFLRKHNISLCTGSRKAHGTSIPSRGLALANSNNFGKIEEVLASNSLPLAT